jgi:ATP-dependent helicase/nuclease subunit A
MSQAAYEINGASVDAQSFYEVACDPQRSVVVEACAGAGKTWVLVSRILRALLDDVPAHQILAITFTKKAAGEMRERLHKWLRDFASGSAEQRRTELKIRGVGADRIDALEPKLAALHEEWLQAGRGVAIHTIHGWFSRLVKAAPLDVLNELQLPPELHLIEDTDELWPELWGRLLRCIDALKTDFNGEGHEPVEVSDFMSLLDELGRHNVEAWLKSALGSRLEVTLADQGGKLDQSVVALAEWDPRWAGVDVPSQAVLNESVRERFWALAKTLGALKAAAARKAALGIESALGLTGHSLQADALTAALFTDAGTPRKGLGDADDLIWAQDWLLAMRQARAQEQGHAMHMKMTRLSRLLFAEYAKLKAERGLADMVDLELAAARLLADPDLSGWIQERLDSQVRQLLMDEFQDTSPLQWQTLKAWLSGYAGAGGGLSGREPIQVFLVGDPKQSIYRFRRADPRVFEAAKDFIIDGLDGVLLACDHTRRNAPGVIDALNLVMGEAHAAGAFPGFRPHTTDSLAQAKVRALPSVLKTDVPKEPDSQGWRDTLATPRETVGIDAKDIEASRVAQAVQSLIRDEGMAPDDIYVLARRRATLALIARALDAHDVPHVAPENTKLIDTPEVSDLVAVLDVLVSPQHDLALAHALKSPLLGASDIDLMQLASKVSHGSWWDALMTWCTQAANANANADTDTDDTQPSPALIRAAHLLLGWQTLAVTAPPHDLLERIVTDGELRARLAAAVPPSQLAQSLSHVDALLTQSLAMDAGRDATPYRWVRAIKKLPVTLPARIQTGAVQLLTIHGAKGLEAKVVFIADTDAQASKSESYALLVDWPESADRPVRCAFVKSESNPPPSLQAAFDAEKLAEAREELNALYVAMTRAREQLIFSRIEPRSAHDESWWQRLARCGAIDPEQPWVITPDASQAQRTTSTLASLLCLPALAKSERSTPPRPLPPEQTTVQILGQTVHRALEWLTGLPVAQRTDAKLIMATQAAARELSLPEELWHDAATRVTTVIRSPELSTWLDPDALAWSGNEVALDFEGQLLRIDRLVAVNTHEGRHWWVLDYKLSHRPQDQLAYRAQLSRYVAAVGALQPGERVSAALISGEGAFVPI